jgi:ABC-type uncharacterized transport system substrate-binding protein
MLRRSIGLLVPLALGLILAPLATHVQPAEKLPRIGVLAPGIPSWEPGRGWQRFRQGLRDLGYIEGQTITLEVRWAENQPERYPDLAMDLVRLPVDIIVAGDAAAALAAQHATSTIPIVMVVSADPVRDGLVASLARPGGNITGLSIMVPEVTWKRLELLAAAVPGLSRIALLMDTGIPSQHAELHDHEAAGWVCSFSPWRCGVPTRSRGPSRRPPRGTPRP